ncbi:MAG: PEGA domain-containing protein [Sandaracinaceae bacterium]|nr:PEGA domain-containing protein [Sandaracinaceae bacterium]
MRSPLRAALAALFLFASPALAHAQDAAPQTPPTEPVAVPDDQAAPDQAAQQQSLEAEARQRFLQGLALARAGDCRGALAELERSFALMARPNTLFNMAQCQEQLFRYDLAVRDYTRYLEIAPPEAEDRATVEAQLRALRNLLGTIHVTLSPALPEGQHAEVWLADRIVGEAPGDVLVPGGEHAIEIRATGFLPARRQVQVTARQTAELSLTLERAQQTIEQHIEQNIEQHVEQNVTVTRQPLPPAVFWTGIVLTGGTAIAGAAAGINALVTHDQQSRLDPRLPRETGAITDSALIADIMFITSGVFLTTTIICAFLTDWTDGAPLETPPAPAVTPTVLMLPGGGYQLGLDARGSF